jgi:2-iminobutanoate/2-iminopropanoate deaminase
MKTHINTEKAPAPVGPYNQSIAAGGMLFISGQIAIDPASGQMIRGSIEEETTMVLNNVGAILAAAGLGFADIVKCSVFVKDMEHFGRINAVYATYFEGMVAPARELVEVVRLPKDANIEISVIADMKND